MWLLCVRVSSASVACWCCLIHVFGFVLFPLVSCSGVARWCCPSCLLPSLPWCCGGGNGYHSDEMCLLYFVSRLCRVMVWLAGLSCSGVAWWSRLPILCCWCCGCGNWHHEGREVCFSWVFVGCVAPTRAGGCCKESYYSRQVNHVSLNPSGMLGCN